MKTERVEEKRERDTRFQRRNDFRTKVRGGAKVKALKVKFLLAEVRYYVRYLDALHIRGALFPAAGRS